MIELLVVPLVLPLNVSPGHDHLRLDLRLSDAIDEHDVLLFSEVLLKLVALAAPARLGAGTRPAALADLLVIGAIEHGEEAHLLLLAERCFRLGENQLVENHFLEPVIDDREHDLLALDAAGLLGDSKQVVLDRLQKLVGEDRPAVHVSDKAVHDDRVPRLGRVQHCALFEVVEPDDRLVDVVGRGCGSICRHDGVLGCRPGEVAEAHRTRRNVRRCRKAMAAARRSAKHAHAQDG